MDSKTIESVSVNNLRTRLTITGFLEPIISENDKEPSWDGSIIIYKTEQKKKSDIIGRVSVQVKGVHNNDFSAIEIKRQVKISDLENYKQQGVLYFVVYVNEHGQEKVYFNTLTPLKIKKILSEAKTQKTKVLIFKEFPDDKKQIKIDLLNFHADVQRQASFVDTDNINLGNLESLGGISNLLVNTHGYQTDNPFYDMQKILKDNELYIYAETKGSPIPIPIDILPKDIAISQEFPGIVSIDDEVFYNSYNVEISKEDVEIQIGKSITIISEDGRTIHKFRYEHADMLQNRIKDLSFLNKLVQAGGYKINGIFHQINFAEDEKHIIKLEEQQELLEYYQKISKALAELHIASEINLAALNDSEKANLHFLVKSIIDNTATSNFTSPPEPIGKLQIQDLNMLVHIEECDGGYIIRDLFASNIKYSYVDNDGERQIASRFTALQKEGFLSVSNIDYDSILSSYKELIEINPKIFEVANNDMLQMLLAYDEMEVKQPRLLQAAKNIAEWIDQEDLVLLPTEIKKLNLLQIYKRERELTKEEKTSLITLIDKLPSTEAEDIKTAGYLLLGYQDLAKQHFDKMDPEARAFFATCPIFYFSEFS